MCGTDTASTTENKISFMALKVPSAVVPFRFIIIEQNQQIRRKSKEIGECPEYPSVVLDRRYLLTI